MRTDLWMRRLDEVAPICITRLHGRSQSVAVVRCGTAYWHRRCGIGCALVASHCVGDERFLLPQVKSGPGGVSGVAALTMDYAAGTDHRRTDGGAHCALWIGQDTGSRNSRGN